MSEQGTIRADDEGVPGLTHNVVVDQMHAINFDDAQDVRDVFSP